MTLNFYGCTFFLNSDEDLSMKLSELSGLLNDVLAQLAKAKAEILDKIESLETALSDVDLPEDAVAALAALSAKAQALDDVVPDAEAPVEE
jgi:ACT domain-containing protein